MGEDLTAFSSDGLLATSGLPPKATVGSGFQRKTCTRAPICDMAGRNRARPPKRAPSAGPAGCRCRQRGASPCVSQETTPDGIFREALAGSVAVGMETKKKNWLLIGAVAVLGLAAVVLLAPYLLRPKVLVTFPVPLSYPGFQVWPTPRTFDQPGTVFLLNRDQIIHVGEVNQPPIKRGYESLMGATTTDTWNGTLLAQYLGTTPAKLNVKSDQKINVTVQLSGAERWMVTEREHPMDKAISQTGLYKRLDEGTPYLVTEAISVNGMEYDVTVDSSQGGTLEIPEAVSANGSISAEKISGSRYSLKQSFSQPHYVFYMAHRSYVRMYVIQIIHT